MTGFVAGAVVAVLLTLALLLRPLLGQRAQTAATASHRQLNAAIHRDQMAELERDRAEGTLSDEDYAQARSELQRRVLEEGTEAEAPATAAKPKKTLLALAVLLPVAAVGIYLLLGNPEGINPPPPEHRFTRGEIEDMVGRLAARMEKEPDNAQGWVMLARSYRAMRRFDEAVKAFDHAIKLVGNDAQLLADYADMLAVKAGGSLAGKPAELVAQALKIDPNNAQALWLSGTVSFEAGRYKEAAAVWERLLKQLPPDSEDAKELAGAIADARSKAAHK